MQLCAPLFVHSQRPRNMQINALCLNMRITTQLSTVEWLEGELGQALTAAGC